MKPSLLVAVLLPLSIPLLSAETPPPAVPAAAAASAVQHLDAPAAAKVLEKAAKTPEKSIAILDVRTPEEFASGHLKGAQNLDIASADFQKNLAKLDPSKTWLVHCAAGGRSTRTLGLLNKLGFKSIIHLDGGLNGWKKAGLPLEKPTPAAK